MIKDRILVAFILVPVFAGAFFSLGRLFLEGNDVPTEAHYQDAAFFLNAKMQPAAGLLLLPAWTLRPIEHLQDHLWEPGDDVTSPLLKRYRSLFVLAEPDAEQELALLKKHFGSAFQKVHQSGAVQIFHIQHPKSEQVGFDFRAELDEKAHVTLVKKNKTLECNSQTQGGWRCPGKDPWQRVTREWLLVTENGRPAIWAHPPRPGEKIHIRFDNLELGKSMAIGGGFTRRGSGYAKSPVDFQVYFYPNLSAQSSIYDAAATPSRISLLKTKFKVEFNWRSFEVSTTKEAGKKGSIVFEVSSDDFRQGHFAFDALLIGGGSFEPLPPLPAALGADALLAPTDGGAP